MRVAAVLLSVFAGSAFALVTPDAAEMNRLQGLLSAAQAADGALVFADRQVSLGQFAPSALEGYRQARERAWKAAIDAVLIAYDMAQPSKEDPSVARLPKLPFTYGKHAGESRQWLVRTPAVPLGEHLVGKQKEIEALDAQADRARANATTTADGTTILFKGDYDSPAALARTLFHERHHFRQFAEAKYKDATVPEMEVEAWTSVVDNIEKFGFAAKQLEAERKRASYMVVTESLKSITARGQRNLAEFGTAIRERLSSGLGDIKPVATSHEGISLDPALAVALREDAERLNESIESEASTRKLVEIAGKFCERGWHRSYLISQYAEVRLPKEKPAVAPSDTCRREVFTLLWRGKEDEAAGADWGAVDHAVLYFGSNPGGSTGCVPSRGFPCPTLSQPVVAAAAQPAVGAVAAQLPRQAQAAVVRDPLGTLNSMAANACSDPWAYGQDELDAKWESTRGVPYDEGASTRFGLQGCQERLFRILLQMAAERNPERLTMATFARTAEAARNPAPAYIADDMPDVPGPQAPTVPTCRHHPWCQSWGN